MYIYTKIYLKHLKIELYYNIFKLYITLLLIYFNF